MSLIIFFPFSSYPETTFSRSLVVKASLGVSLPPRPTKPNFSPPIFCVAGQIKNFRIFLPLFQFTPSRRRKKKKKLF